MLKRYMLLILMGSNLAAQCAEQQEFTLDHAAICRHQMAYNPENWNVLSANIAGNLFKRYPDITKKELVSLFRWVDEKGNQRSSVLPLPMLQKIWHYTENSQFSDAISQFNDNLRSAFGLLLPNYIPRDEIASHWICHNSRQTTWLMKSMTWLMKSMFSKEIYNFIDGTITYMPLSLIRQNMGVINTSEPSETAHTDIRSYTFWEQNYAHLIFAANRYVLAVTYVPYNDNTTLTNTSWTNEVKKACAEGYARRFSTLYDALEWILSLPQR